MTLVVNITENCLESARRHGVLDEVRRLAERVEKTQSTSSFDKFPQPYMVKKKVGGRQHRLIAQYSEVEDFAVVSFLDVMIRGNRDYDAPGGFGNNPQRYGEKYFDGLVTAESLRNFINRRRGEPPGELPPPTDEEYELLYDGFARRDIDDSLLMVYETNGWITAISDDRVRSFLSAIADAVLSAYQGASGFGTKDAHSQNNLKITYLKNDDGLLLIGLTGDGNFLSPPDDADRIERAYKAGQTIDIRREARRAYPGYVLADTLCWTQIEHEQQANLALSPEESEVLSSARSSSTPFPLFINGRAGSGKSTILQYLCATFTRTYLKSSARPKVSPPLYLTANTELLRTAKERVAQLIKLDYEISGAEFTESSTDSQKTLDAVFQDFQSFELSLLGVEERRSRFPLSNKISYFNFRNRWREKFGQQPQSYENYGPELSWHVIRTYIKGMNSEDYLDPSEYNQLPSAQKSVSQETYELIFEKVWQGWYEELCARAGLWDDQDLARYILENERAKPKYPAVFCDEAQDFTRIELELLLKINLFSARNLTPEDLGKVCFVFAGDQFQTLNPTGFRWEAIKSAYVEKFIHEMERGRRTRPELNYKELEFNYRSTERIVRFSNAVQAYRAAQFELPELRPQTPWSIDHAPFPVDYFNATDAEFWRRYRDMTGVITIIPCAEGEERRYVEADAILKANIMIADGVPQNVFSASRAKGSEYQAVLLYGFGEYFRDHIARPDLENDAAERQERALAFEYFINRLYVAVSRPKRRLIVVDGESTFSQLWNFATNSEGMEAIWRKWPRGRDIWADTVEGMHRGIHVNLSEATKVDRRELAQNFRAEGKVRRDSYYLRQAAVNYQAAGERASQAECLGLALEYEENFIEAGRAYADGGFSKDAVRMYWRSGEKGWQELVALAMTNTTIRDEPEAKVASAIDTKKSGKRWKEALELIRNGINDSDLAARFLETPEWSKAVNRLIEMLLDNRSDTVAECSSAALYLLTESLRKGGIEIVEKLRAHVCFAAEKWSEAIDAYERAGLTTDTHYLEAKERTSAYPENILAMKKRSAFSEIVDAYRKSASIELSKDQAAAVCDALLEVGDVPEAIKIAWTYGLSEGLNALVADDEVLRGEPRKAALHGMLRGFLKTQAWDGIAYICDRRYPVARAFTEKFQQWPDEDNEYLKVVFVGEWARLSDDIKVPERPLAAIRKMLKSMGDRYIQGAKHDKFSLHELGRAIERAGRYVDARDFYAGVRSPPFTSEEKSFSQQRLLIVKNRFVKSLLEKGGESGQTRQLSREIQSGLAQAKLKSLESIEKIVKLEPIEFKYAFEIPPNGNAPPPSGERHEPETSMSPDPQEPSTAAATAAMPEIESLIIRAFDIEFSRQVKRVNIKHRQTLETCFINLQKNIVGGEKTFEKIREGLYRCAEWGMQIAITTEEIEAAVSIELPGISLKLTLRNIPVST